MSRTTAALAGPAVAGDFENVEMTSADSGPRKRGRGASGDSPESPDSPDSRASLASPLRRPNPPTLIPIVAPGEFPHGDPPPGHSLNDSAPPTSAPEASSERGVSHRVASLLSGVEGNDTPAKRARFRSPGLSCPENLEHQHPDFDDIISDMTKNIPDPAGVKRQLSYAGAAKSAAPTDKNLGKGPGTAGRANGRPPGGRPPPGQPFAPSDFPVIIDTVEGNFSSLSPWERERLISKAVPGFKGVLRRLPSGSWLVDCADQETQGRVFRLRKLGPGIEIKTSRPRPVVVGVVRDLPQVDDLETLIKEDLAFQDILVDKVTRLVMAGGAPSKAVRISFFSHKLPDTIKLGRETFQVHPFTPQVRRCTKCQLLGHVRSKCRRKLSRCARCGREGHQGKDCTSADLCCVNCGGPHSAAWPGCPEIALRRKAGEIRSARYMPYMHALSLAKDLTKSQPDQMKKPPPKAMSKSNTAYSQPRAGKGHGAETLPTATLKSQGPSAPAWSLRTPVKNLASSNDPANSPPPLPAGEGEDDEIEEIWTTPSQHSAKVQNKNKQKKKPNKSKAANKQLASNKQASASQSTLEDSTRMKALPAQQSTTEDISRRKSGTPNTQVVSSMETIRNLISTLGAELCAESPELRHLFEGIVALLNGIDKLLSEKENGRKR